MKMPVGYYKSKQFGMALIMFALQKQTTLWCIHEKLKSKSIGSIRLICDSHAFVFEVCHSVAISEIGWKKRWKRMKN